MLEFQQKFIDEVNEMMAELELSLLAFEKNPDQKHLIDAIFRDMHTLKGSAGMFGYDSVVEITHKTESLYTKIKNNEIHVNEKIINITFSVTDLIKRILTDKNLLENSLKKQFYIITEELNEYFSAEELEKESRQKNYDFKVFFIKFEPDADVESRGINISKIFQELNKLGQIKIIPKPCNKPEKYNMSWEIFLATRNDEEDIEEILTFVDLESEINLLSEKNLLLNNKFIEIINQAADKNELFDLDELQEIVKQIFEQENAEEKSNTGTSQKSTLRVNADKLDDLMKHLSELITIKSEIKLTASLKNYLEIIELSEKLDKVTAFIQDDIFDIRLVNLEGLRVNIERLIRDTAIALKKEVQFTSSGLDTELDKTIVEKLSGPLMHIVRNSIDHGIETTDIRAKRNKTAHGNINLKAFQSGSYVYIEVSDDGNGIDKKKLLEKAILKNIIPAGTKMSDKEIYNLIFEAGLTTAANLSQISGRGVGMDAVKTEIVKLRGTVEVKSETGTGTTILLKLPVSISIIDTLLIKTGNMFFSVPVEDVESCLLTNRQTLNQNNNKYLNYDSGLIPFLDLREIFEINDDNNESEIAIIIKKEGKKNAIIVDKVVGEYQAVVKPLGHAFKEREFLSGGSLMADGNIAYILDVMKLVEYYTNKEYNLKI